MSKSTHLQMNISAPHKQVCQNMNSGNIYFLSWKNKEIINAQFITTYVHTIWKIMKLSEDWLHLLKRLLKKKSYYSSNTTASNKTLKTIKLLQTLNHLRRSGNLARNGWTS